MGVGGDEETTDGCNVVFLGGAELKVVVGVLFEIAGFGEGDGTDDVEGFGRGDSEAVFFEIFEVDVGVKHVVDEVVEVVIVFDGAFSLVEEFVENFDVFNVVDENAFAGVEGNVEMFFDSGEEFGVTADLVGVEVGDRVDFVDDVADFCVFFLFDF